MAKRKSAAADKGPFNGIKVNLKAVLEGNVVLDLKANCETFADLSKLARKIDDTVSGIRKVLPDMALRKLEKLAIEME